MVTLVTILHIFVCVFLILVVLLQAGKGGGMGLAFGSSGAQTVFGGSGAGNFLTKLTAATAVIFMVTSLTLAFFASARQGAWLDEYEKRMAAQAQRDKAAREKLAAPPEATAGDGGPRATEAPTDVAPTEPKTDDKGTPAAPGATEPAPASDKAPASDTAPAPDKATPAPAPTPAAAAPSPRKPAAAPDKPAKPAEPPAKTP